MAVQTTKISGKWMFWQVLYLFVLTGFAGWCYVDGEIWMKDRGAADAEYKTKVYLEAATKAEYRGSEFTIADPAAELQTLSKDEATLRSRSGSGDAQGRLALAKLAALDLLVALDRVNLLRAERTTFTNPSAALADLTAKWSKLSPPKPLAGFDIPSQRLMLGASLAVDLLVIVVLLKTITTRFKFDPDTNTLTLPNGKNITPADLAEVDKRKWEKLRCSLVLTDGQSIPLDLLRYVPLEEWVLTLEKAAGKA